MPITLVIFDMDGTLTEELLDFDAIRRDIGLADRVPILEAIAGLDAPGQTRAHQILDRHELSAAEACALHPGAAETLAALRSRRVAVALLTRNSARCAAAVLARHALTLDHVASREDLPHKPHPDSILNIVRKFGRTPGQTLMVGDYLYDLDAAAAAGVRSVLLCTKPTRPPFASQATWCVPRLLDIVEIVDRENQTPGP